MSVYCDDRMHAVLADLEAGVPGLELDVSEECIESWTHNYAIGLVDITEPDDDQRAFFDLDAAVKKIIGVATTHFGKTFELALKPVGNREGQFLRIHRPNAGWSVEIEAYRRKSKEK